MPNQTLEEIIQNTNADGSPGETTSDYVLKRNVIKEVVYKQSDLISVGTNVLPERNFENLDVTFAFPSEIEADYPVEENSVVDRSKVTWQEMDMSLHQAEARFMITDMAQLRQQGSVQNETSTRRAAEALAREKDHNILDTLSSGAPTATTTTLDTSSDEAWNQSNGDPEDNIISAWNDIFDNSNVRESDMERSHLVVPAKVYSEMTSLQLINNVQQNLRDYIEGSLGLNIWFSRHFTSDAILAVGGEQTGIHGVLDTDEIPLVETERQLGRGEDTLSRQFFNTGIMEDDGASSGESYRIAKIENVAN
jgi:hypothetical protein